MQIVYWKLELSSKRYLALPTAGIQIGRFFPSTLSFLFFFPRVSSNMLQALFPCGWLLPSRVLGLGAASCSRGCNREARLHPAKLNTHISDSQLCTWLCAALAPSACLFLSVFQPPCFKGEDAPVYGEGDLGPICLDHQPVQCCKPVNSYSSSLFSSCGVQMDHKKTGKSLNVRGGRVEVTLARSL